MGRTISKNLSKTLSGNYSQKPFDDANKFAIDPLKSSPFKNSRSNWWFDW